MVKPVPVDPQMALAQEKLKGLRARTDLRLKPMKHLKETFTDFDGKEKPLKIRYYQIQGIFHLIIMKRFLLGDDTGLGKTLEAIVAMCGIWETDTNRKAVILTTKSATRQWLGEFVKFTRGVRVYVCRGTPGARQNIRSQFEKATGPSVIIMGYRTAVQDFRHLQDWEGHVYIFDEATAFKNNSTQVHQACRYLAAKSDRSWGLTATLIKNNLMEGYGVYEVVMPSLFKNKPKKNGPPSPKDNKPMSRLDFMMYYCITRMQPIPRSRRQVPVIVGYHPDKIKEFREVIDPYFIGRPKHEVASELPSLTTRTVEVDLTPEQETKYAEALAGLLVIGDKADSDVKEVSKLSAIVYCQEIVNHPGLIECAGESSKLEALLDLVTEGDFEADKIIVFTRFRKLVDIIMPALKAAGVQAVRVTGAEDENQRAAAMKAFQDPNSDVRVACITTAGSEAINLQAAKAVVCFDTPWSAGDFLQLVGRMIRIGSVHDRCYVVHLVAKRLKGGKTVDHRVMEVLQNKMALVEAVLGKRIKGESDGAMISAENEISDLFSSLREDAKEGGS